MLDWNVYNQGTTSWGLLNRSFVNPDKNTSCWFGLNQGAKLLDNSNKGILL